MAENSHISWTDNTHNEWIGCTKVSAGCDNCYAETLMDTRYGKVQWGKGRPRILTSEANRRKPFTWERRAVREGRRIKVFAMSLADWADEEVPDEWRDGLFATVRATPHLDWLFLTKRLAKMLRYVATMSDIPPNVWWGCSVEDQTTADQRIPELLKLRGLGVTSPLWLSVEPLLGPVNLDGGTWLYEAVPDEGHGIDWVVVGGESGSHARPMHPDWARSLRDQCVAAGVAFHLKQWGEFAPNWLNYDSGNKIPGSEWVDRMGKKMAGREIDGREWNEFPNNK